jgi:heptosyltransferase-2
MLAHGFADAARAPKMTVPDGAVEAMRARLSGLPRPLYALAIGTSETHKQWGIDRYASLASRLLEEGRGVLILGGPAEKEQALALTAAVPEHLRRGLMTLTDAPVLGSAAALKLSDCCLGNDTGMVNVAAAVGTPTYVMIGARARLDHDPDTLHNVMAATLPDITVEHVLDLLRKSRHGANHA